MAKRDGRRQPRKSAFERLLDVELAVVVALALAFAVPQLFGCVPDVVMSESMEPEIPAGAVAMVDTNVAASDLEVGDVAVYEAAEALGIPRARLSGYEHGKTAIPLLVIRDVAELVGCSVDELLGRDVDPKPIRTYRDALGYLRGLRVDYDAAASAGSGEVEHAAWRLCSQAEALGWMFGVEPKAMTAAADKRGER